MLRLPRVAAGAQDSAEGARHLDFADRVAAAMVATRWLGATAIHSQSPEMPSLVAALGALCEQHLQLRVLVNFFDQTEVDTAGLVQRHTRNSTSRVEGTWVPGMKTLFWYKHLTPERTQHLQVVWVFDCDIAVHPSVLPLAQLASALIATRATVLQPSIQAQVHGTYHTWLRVKRAHMSCLATTAQYVEMQTPLFAGDAWARFHQKVLAVIPEEGLVTSDFGLDVMWCAFLRDEFPHRPTCLVTPSATATHLNSHEIEKHMSKEVALKERSCTKTCETLRSSFSKPPHAYWKNYSHHTGECWSVEGHHGLQASHSHYAIDGDGMIRARYGQRPSSSANGASESAATLWETDRVSVRFVPRGLGAATIDARDKHGIVFFTQGLFSLFRTMPGLRIELQVRNGGPVKDRKGLMLDVSLDDRIATHWVDGPRSLFWKTVITPALLQSSNSEFLWLFDATIAVHPPLNPLPQLVQMLRSTEAAVVYSRVQRSAAIGEEPNVMLNTSCLASTSRYAPFGPSSVFRADAWKHFWTSTLQRTPDEWLARIEPGFPRVFCGVAYHQHFGKKPACVEAQLMSSQIADEPVPARRRGRAEAPAVPTGCPKDSCETPLRKMHPNAFDAIAHDDGTCWFAAPRGLMSRGGRPGPVKRGGRG